MYKVIVTTGGTTATASKQCRTKKEAETIRTKLLQILTPPVSIDITPIGSDQ